jgi:O-antigen ligase
LLAKIVISYGKISTEKLSYFLCLAVLVLALIGVIADLFSIEILFGKEIFEQGRFSFTMGGCNRAAFYLSSSLLILLAIYIKSKETGFLKNLFLYYLPFTIILYALILTAEKKSIYILPFFFITFILISKKYKHFIFLLITFGIILCSTNIPDRLDISNISLKSSSATARLKAWEISYHLIKQKPIIGHGYGSFTERSRVFFNQNKSKLSFAKYKPLYCAHNIVLDTLTEIGFIGLIFVIYIFMFVLVKIFKESNPNDFIFYVGLIIIFIFLETFVGSFTRSFHRTNYSFFIIGICIGFLSKQKMNLKKDISII